MTKISERKKALEAVLERKINELQQIVNQSQQIELARNNVTTEIVGLRGKLDLLNELEKEEKKEEEKKENSA